MRNQMKCSDLFGSFWFW